MGDSRRPCCSYDSKPRTTSNPLRALMPNYTRVVPVYCAFLAALCQACAGNGTAEHLSQLSDLYAQGVQPGQTVGEAKRRFGGLYFPESGSANYADTTITAVDGFSTVVLGVWMAGSDAPPADDERIERVVVWARAPGAARAAMERITEALGTHSGLACYPATSDLGPILAMFWNGPGEGVVLEVPPTAVPWSARLTFFRGSWAPRRVTDLDFDKCTETELHYFRDFVSGSPR